MAAWLGRANGIALWSVVFLLVVYPLFMVLAAALAPAFPDSQPLKLSDLLSERLIIAATNTLRLGISVSLLSLITGSALALLAAQSPQERWIDLLMGIPFLTPPFLASLAWSLAVGRKGYLSQFGQVEWVGRQSEQFIFSFWGLSLLMAVHYAPIVYFAVRAQIERIPSSLLWAGQIAGAAPRKIIGRILLPMIFPALLAAGFLAFACGIEEYGTPLVIGNRIGFPVIATEIGRIVRVYPINLTLASALASMLLALVGSVYALSYFLQRQAKVTAKASSHATPNLLSAPARAGLWLFASLYFLFTLAIPYGAMVLTSLLQLVSAGPTLGNLTLAHYFQVLTDESSGLREALMASFALALMAALLGTFIGAACARAGVVLVSLALIPAATPAITMAVGFIRGWNAPWTAWLPLYGSAVIVGLFYTAQYLPYAVQYARAGLATIPSSYEWAARIHGAGMGLTTRRIVAPLLWPHCLAGAILIFSISFRELVGSVLLRPPGMQTVSTFILREFDQGSPATGMAMGVIAVSVSMLSISLARRLVPKKL
ncbi:MAG TPA: ABC transporter permease subunit [Terriglobales bacterium]|nr:ABC transporter permease subunit [Terriglobales bacterium]